MIIKLGFTLWVETDRIIFQTKKKHIVSWMCHSFLSKDKTISLTIRLSN